MIEKIVKYSLGVASLITLLAVIFPSNATLSGDNSLRYLLEQNSTPIDDTIKDVELPFPFAADDGIPFTPSDNSPLYGSDPSNIQEDIEYDPATGDYIFRRRIGGRDIETPFSSSFDDYLKYDAAKSMQNYWRQRARSESVESYSSLIPKLQVGGEVFDRIFGGNTIDIRPQGAAELSFGLNISYVDNPTYPENIRRNVVFDFDEKIQMNVVGQIGDKMKLNVQYDTESAFDFENSVKIEYTGYDDEIIQKIEAGNVSLPLSGTLISGSQSLFGFKTELKFGRLNITTLFSQQKGETSSIEVQGGAQTKEYEIYADKYEANKHYFLGHFFKENYDRFLSSLPIITSGININKIEVWVTNKQGNYENSRNIVAFPDLGEANPDVIEASYTNSGSFSTNPYPSDSANILAIIETLIPEVRNINSVGNALLAAGFEGGIDYEKIESARLLSPSEYTVNTQLGYISLNSTLASDQVLAVAYEYTVGGKVYRVGEFSNSSVNAPDALVLKLIKGTSFTPQMKVWDLMMKNIYSIGAYQLSNQDFYLDVYYKNDRTGTEINFLPAGAIDSTRLLTVLNLDNLNSQLDPYADGIFDFINGITINPSNGRVIFPVREPFGSYMRKKITGGNPALNEVADQYVFEELYDSTQSTARQIAEKNKFFIAGRYKSSSGSDISLNAINIPQGSVKVTAGAQVLTENVHYTVDYNLGRVKIIDAGILESGTPLKITLESNSLFNIQTKTLVGTHLNYEISKDFNIGATILNLTERPMSTKVSIGDEPISNTIWGVNTSYRTNASWLTKAIDFIPFIETKEMSTLTFTGEFAQLIPGHSKAIDKEGNAYIDDFEGSESNIDIKSFSAWTIASTPNDPDMFPEHSGSTALDVGYNRAKIAWYVIDPLFYRTSSPVDPEMQSSHMVREVYESEIFPYKESVTGIPTNMAVLNLAYYPEEKGPYNYAVNGLTPDGKLTNPSTRWGGIMRKLETNDFEEANIEYIEFWMMDPFVEDSLNTGGDLYFNLGDVSEDVLKDGRKSFEHGLPTPANNNAVDTTLWGIIPMIQSLVSAFDNDAVSRAFQDIGLDGLNDEQERSFFALSGGWHNYLDQLAQLYGTESAAYLNALNDPSNDNYHYYRGTDYDDQNLGINERYKLYNGLEGNSPSSDQSNEDYSTSASASPNVEDINRDNTLNENETYFQYRVSIRPEDFVVGKNFITDKIEYNAKFANNERSKVTWYQFKIPVYSYDRRVGVIQDFKSIRFVRMFMKGFSDPTIIRMATLDLVRGEWRKYNGSFMQPGEYNPVELGETPFYVTAVNIEENGNKTPVNYILPPDINRQIDPTNPQLRQLNEQAMVLRVIDLQDGDARAVYKNLDMDMRKYKKLKMYIHAESLPTEAAIYDDDVSVFIRLGSDYKNNYYEYEIPLKVTAPGRYEGVNEDDPDRYLVWPIENNLDLDFEMLQEVKQQRNDDMRQLGSGVTLTRVYSMMDGANKVSVMGNPNLSNVRTVMIGVRNPRRAGLTTIDDGLPKSAEIWVNELRLTDFDEKGGWAANARFTAKLADFGSVTVAGQTSKPGFGSIEQKLSERQKEEINRYDISSNLELGKFFPEKLNVRVPLYMGYSENVKNPEYNPLDPDIPLSVALSDPTKTEAEIKEIKYKAQDYTSMKSLNFNNVKVNKTSGKMRIYDLANWSASYGFNETFHRDINTEFNTNRYITGALSYNYNATPKNYEPFKNVKFLSKPAFRLIKDFNIYLLPSQLSFRTNLNRQYAETQLRNVYNEDVRLPVSVNKDFLWQRQYDLKYNISKGLKIDFSATNSARIDEPQGRLYKGDADYEAKMDTIYTNLLNMGRNTQYHHTFDVTYTIPINKIGIFNWVTANARYSGNYDWVSAPITADTINIGNTVSN
nr:cell surface protein SprA [Bacteroidales bacterium]